MASSTNRDYTRSQISYLCGEISFTKFNFIEKLSGSVTDTYLDITRSCDDSPIYDEQRIIQLNNERYKIIKEAKRQWLHVSLSVYENKLQNYDQNYREMSIHLKSVLSSNGSIHFASVSNSINRYITHRTNQFKQDILEKISIYREKLIKHRQLSSSTKSMIGVSPEPYLDLKSNPFNALEWNYLSLGKIFSL